MKKYFLTKNDSVIIYGVAILLMIYHHLFAFPERLNYNYVNVLEIGNINIDYYIGVFGKLCVALYAFISGYGLTISKLNRGVRQSLFQLINLYKKFWLVFIVFIPIGFCNSSLNFNFKELFLNFIAYKVSYNLEWWYMWEYVRMIVMFPAMVYFIKYIDSIKLNKECIVKSLIYLCIILLLRRADVYLAVFLVGILCARYELLEKFNNLFINKDKLYLLC